MRAGMKLLARVFMALDEAAQAGGPLTGVHLRLYSDGAGSVVNDDGATEEDIYRFETIQELLAWAAASQQERKAIEAREQASRDAKERAGRPN